MRVNDYHAIGYKTDFTEINDDGRHIQHLYKDVSPWKAVACCLLVLVTFGTAAFSKDVRGNISSLWHNGKKIVKLDITDQNSKHINKVASKVLSEPVALTPMTVDERDQIEQGKAAAESFAASLTQWMTKTDDLLKEAKNHQEKFPEKFKEDAYVLTLYHLALASMISLRNIDPEMLEALVAAYENEDPMVTPELLPPSLQIQTGENYDLKEIFLALYEMQRDGNYQRAYRPYSTF